MRRSFRGCPTLRPFFDREACPPPGGASRVAARRRVGRSGLPRLPSAELSSQPGGGGPHLVGPPR
eukprot:1767097-Pyramimonas_sp.AAC.1